MFTKFVIVLLLPFVGMSIHLSYLIEVDPADFVCQHQKQVKGNSETFFKFVMNPRALEKLLPWLTRFKEADKRIISTGKSYTALIWIPILGERRVYGTLVDYRPSKLIAFEFSDDYVKQKIIIQIRKYHDRTLLHTTVYSRRSSLLYQYTIGYALRAFIKSQLESSMKNLALTFENLNKSSTIPDFSRNNS